ncbi:MAG TPA: choice-of-anchor tandem repeat GloVer-containing protein [Candidatus Cybelea sp.]|jgi:uncharacterized repeat protein (TIGR03803 family)
MRNYAFGRCVTISAALALLAGCSDSQPIGTPDVMRQTLSHAIAHRTSTGPSYHVLYSFAAASDGSAPEAALVAVNNTLYGTTTKGGIIGGVGRGTIFSVSASGNETVLHSFGLPGQHDGWDPMASLIAVNGMLYGTTEFGRRGGTVFKIGTAGKNERVLHGFVPTRGRNPTANLVDVDGTLYGTTTTGGPSNAGTVFGITMSGKWHRLYAFSGSPDGSEPWAGLIGVHGALYGTTFFGGAHGFGTVFSITTSGKERVLHSFAGTPDASEPYANLIEVKGTLYGTTTGGGKAGHGTVFSITTSGEEKVLYSFLGTPDAAVPYGGLIAVNSTLYGVTTQGGTGYPPFGAGTVYSISTNGKKERVLHSFADSPDGAVPYGSLIDLDATLYGTTYLGGNPSCEGGCGTVFSLNL